MANGYLTLQEITTEAGSGSKLFEANATVGYEACHLAGWCLSFSCRQMSYVVIKYRWYT